MPQCSHTGVGVQPVPLHTQGSEAAVHPAGKCRDGCRVSLGLGKRHPARHPPSSLPWYRECPSPAGLCHCSASSTGLHLPSCATSWAGTPVSLAGGNRHIPRTGRDQKQGLQPPLGQGWCTGEDKHTWEQSLPSPVPKASTGIAQQAQQFFHFLLQSAAGFDEMAAPTSSYEKTRPLEAGECQPWSSEAVGLTVRLWQHAGRHVLWWDGVLTCTGRQEKVAELQVSLEEAEVWASPGCLGLWKEYVGLGQSVVSSQELPVARAACGHGLSTWPSRQRRRAGGRRRRSGRGGSPGSSRCLGSR